MRGENEGETFSLEILSSFFFSLVNFLAHAQDAWSEAGVNCALKIPRVPYLFD